MFGPRSLREIDLGVSETGALGPYEKRFLCGVEGVRELENIDVEFVLPMTGGVRALDPDRSLMAWGTSLSNISDRKMDEYVRFASRF